MMLGWSAALNWRPQQQEEEVGNQQGGLGLLQTLAPVVVVVGLPKLLNIVWERWPCSAIAIFLTQYRL
jgi:hypothetical protein